MSVSTTKGDDGTTGLLFGGRVSKADIRMEVVGTIDELNAALGLVRAYCGTHGISIEIHQIQRDLIDKVMGEIVTPEERKEDYSSRFDQLTQFDVDKLTNRVHEIERHLAPLKDWFIPGDSAPGAFLEQARVICRRAERRVIELDYHHHVNPHLVPYLNRLSDLLWVYARKVEAL